MKKKIITIVCMLYAGLILYVYFMGYLSHFLAPKMHKYILSAALILLFIGLVALINKKFTYQFKLIDLILFLPIIAIFFAGTGKISLSLAKNRSNNFSMANKKASQVEDNTAKKEPSDNSYSQYDFTKVDYDVVDAAYSSIVDYLSNTDGVKNATGKTIRIRGFTVKKADYITPGYFAIGKYNISCCVADASVYGLLVDYDLSKIEDNGWYEIEGVLEKVTNKWGYETLAIKAVKVTEIDKNSEQLYIYPCYAYDNGSCSVLDNYDLK